MELIPVFAFIVLVSTIGTFIFAVAAYILFKIRERKRKFEKAPPPAFQAEVFAPGYHYVQEPQRMPDEPRLRTEDRYREFQGNESSPYYVTEVRRTNLPTGDTGKNNFIRYKYHNHQNEYDSKKGNGQEWK